MIDDPHRRAIHSCADEMVPKYRRRDGNGATPLPYYVLMILIFGMLQIAFVSIAVAREDFCTKDKIRSSLGDLANSNEIHCDFQSSDVCTDEFGNSLLWVAILNGNYEASNSLFECGISLQNEKSSMLHTLASGFGSEKDRRILSEDIKLLEKLLSSGMNTDDAAGDEHSALFKIVESVCRTPVTGSAQSWSKIRSISVDSHLRFHETENVELKYLQVLSELDMYDKECLEIFRK